MKPKKSLKDDVELALQALHQKIDSLKEKVDKLCETTNCFEPLKPKEPPKNKK